MKKLQSLFPALIILFVLVVSTQTTIFGQEKKGNLALIKGKTLVFVPQDRPDSQLVMDFIRSNTSLEIVSDRSKDDFSISLSTGPNDSRYFHPTKRQTPLATITNQIEGPMLDQPAPPQTVVISSITQLTVVTSTTSGNPVVVWKRSTVTPFAPSSYVPNQSDSPHLRLKDLTSSDKAKVKLLQSFVKDLSKLK